MSALCQEQTFGVSLRDSMSRWKTMAKIYGFQEDGAQIF
jgi:hypothetical protein